MLKFIALSGTIGVTENLYIYEANNRMMIVDCGVGFPDLEMHGVDLVIPDFSYIIKNKEKLDGIVVSQGHEDHIGAIPYLLKHLTTDVWAAPLVKEFLLDKLEDFGGNSVKINTFNPSGDKFNIGPFTIHPFRVTHSIPDTVGFAIDTPEGRVFHVPEHKMDQNPVDGMRFDIEKAKELAKENVLFLASDCLGANKPGTTEGELHIEANFERIARLAKQAVFATAISSNIGRFQQMINVAERIGRKVIFIGRSVQKKTEIAHQLGILKYKKDTVIDFRNSLNISRNRIMYIVAGCYGQDGSTIHKLALDKHEKISVEEGDTVIFSADPAPPYTKESEDFVIDKFFSKGADVHYYDLNENLYVSGHGSQEDIRALFNIVRPKYYIPIGGTVRFMHAYRKLVVSNGAPKENVFLLNPGENVDFENGKARTGNKIASKEILVHGLGIGDIGKIVLGERSVLGNEGVVVAVFKINKEKIIVEPPALVSRGFIFEKIDKNILIEAVKKLTVELGKGRVEKNKIESVSQKVLEKYFFNKIGRRPMILPVVVEV